MSTDQTTTRLSRADLEHNAGVVQRMKDAGMAQYLTDDDYLITALATDARAYMTALEPFARWAKQFPEQVIHPAIQDLPAHKSKYPDEITWAELRRVLEVLP